MPCGHFQCPAGWSGIATRALRRFRSPLSVAALAAGFVLGVVEAVDNLSVSITMTFNSTISINWCDSAGNNDSTSAQTWQLGTGPAVNTTYQTVGTTYGTVPTLRYIENASNVSVDISAICSASTSWAASSSNGVNIFRMGVSVNGGAFNAVDTLYQDRINNLGLASVGTQIGLQLITPTSMTLGGGLQQTITVTFTASADNGD